MPNILTIAEADYIAAHNDYEAARVAFYAGTPATYRADAEAFLKARKTMEAALAAWEADREAA